MIVTPYILTTRSGLHCGIGQGISDIDMPTAKESVSGLPYVPGTTMKGVLRDFFEGSCAPSTFEAAFGQSGAVPEFAAALSFGDARLLCLPARSYFGVFAYVSSPYTLRILRDLLQQKQQECPAQIPAFATATQDFHAAVTSGTVLCLTTHNGNRILLEDLDLFADINLETTADAWAEMIAGIVYPEDTANAAEDRQFFRSRFIIVPDDVMSFLCETALPVAARIRIGDNGVVETGALWYEEYVPPETLFAGVLLAESGRGQYRDLSAQVLLDAVTASPIDLQIGGGATVGRGLVHLQFCK